MAKIEFKDLNKHMFDASNKCIGFDIEIANIKFHITKDANDWADTLMEGYKETWRMKSYTDANLPTLMFEMQKANSDLILIAETALYYFGHYLMERMKFYKSLLDDMEESLGAKR